MAFVTVGRSMCTRPLLTSLEDTFSSFILIPPVLVVRLWQILSNQSMWPFMYFKLKIVLTVTQFWVSPTHGLEFSQSRIFGSVLVTFIAMTKYVARRNITGRERRIYFGWWCERIQPIMHGRRDCRKPRVTRVYSQRGINAGIRSPFSLSPFYSAQAPAHEMVSPISSIRSSP